ncbi:MAG: GTP 3',8-cyclase MoaA [Oscillospiraceae bacterium]|nr:GTP 3',8-cyclase MoaA [Oscillospiraceae bacterium]
MKDNFGRDIYYLRLSVTDKCNLRCVYCMPETGVKKLRHEDVLTVEEIAEIVRAAAACGICKVRVTGGEPLVRRGIIEICKSISEIESIREICLTTNGILVPQFAEQLKSAGVNRLNISLDSLSQVTYNEITRNGNLNDALTGIDAALDAGFDAIKINAVLIGGVNDNVIPALLELTRKKKVNVRFIELMPVGECAQWAKTRFISAQSVLQIAPELCEVGTDGVSKLYMLPDGLGTVGLISPISSHFCPTCNRIRITADGMLKPCLHSAEEINLRGLHGEKLVSVIRNAIANKPRKHRFDEFEHSKAARNMNAIGG